MRRETLDVRRETSKAIPCPRLTSHVSRLISQISRLTSHLLIILLCSATYAAPPLAPSITWPPAGAILASNRIDVGWSGGGHDRYEIHIGSHNTPSSADAWDSGEVSVPYPGVVTAETPPLTPEKTYYVFVRLHNSEGWGPWSAPFRHFYVAGEWGGDPYNVKPEGGQQRDHAIVFSPARNEYLVSYMDIQPDQRWYAKGWRLSSAGTRIGPEIRSDGGEEGAGATAVTYNSMRGEYLIAARDMYAHLFGQRVSAVDGSLPAEAVFIHNANATLEHDIAYASVSDVYLEIWRDDGAGGCTAVKARRLDGATGAPIGSVITVVSNGLCVGGPKASYNPAADEFFITYQQVPPSDQQDLYCRRISASTGALLGAAATPLAVSGVTEWNNGIAYDSDLNRFLVAYEKYDPQYTAWGQFVAADATLIGAPFPIDGPAWRGGAVRCAWNAATKEYLVVWLHGISEANYARRVSQTGGLVGQPFRTNGGVTGFGNFGPIVAANSVSGDFLICWQNNHTDVYTRRYKPYPLPPPDVTAPAPVTNLSLTRYANAIGLQWTNPATPDYAGALVRVKTTGFPSGPTDGTLVIDQPGAPGSAEGVEQGGLARGTYYYAVFAHDEVPNHAPAALATASVLPGDFDGDGDIDQVDFGHLQTCLGPDGAAHPPECRDADLSLDHDVDAQDFGLFLPCMGGAEQPPGC